MDGSFEEDGDTPLILASWDAVSSEWMSTVLVERLPGVRVRDVEVLLRDDGTNRRARLGLTYAADAGPATVFAKAESDAPGRRQIHAANGNLFNEALLFRSGRTVV